MVKRDNLIKTLLVGVLGVLLTSGAFIQPASARSFNPHEYAKNKTTQSTTQSGDNVNKSSLVTQVDGGFMSGGKYYKNGIVSSLDAEKLREGWNVLNGDADKVVLYRNGTLASGWVKTNRWYYFDPVTHFMITNQAKVIDGKEYFFRYDGVMMTHCNVNGYYYGLSGAKEGTARSGDATIGTHSKALYDYSLNEYDSLVKQGKIKAKFSWSTGSVMGDDSITSNLDFYEVQ